MSSTGLHIAKCMKACCASGLIVGILFLWSSQVGGAEGTSKRTRADRAERGECVAAKESIEEQVEKAALSFKVNLPADTKDLLAKEIVSEQWSAEKEFQAIGYSDKDVWKLMSAIAAKTRATNKGTKIDAATIEAIRVEQKVEAVKPTLFTDIYANAERAKIKLVGETPELLYSDLFVQTTKLARSWIPIKEIRHMNTGYMHLVFAKAASPALDADLYGKVKSTIFQQIVHLTIKSCPSEADVEIAGRSLGKTVIEKKRFYAGREYIFWFKLKDHEVARRNYYVAPVPEYQEIEQILFEIPK
jgi:hypothetical protein